jgi:hypothetical protein
MKKNFIIAVLIILTVLSLIFGLYQKDIADKFEAKLSKELLNKEKERKCTESLIQDLQKRTNMMKKELEVKNKINRPN